MNPRPRANRRAAGAWASLPLALLVGACAGERSAESAGGDALDPEASGTYEVRLDSDRGNLEEFRLVVDDDGIRIQTGPAGIAYRESDRAESGDFRAEATFVQYGAPLGYREAYGIFVGGLDLDGPEVEYTYLLVRSTGDFLIKRRLGEITETVVDWSPHASVETVLAEGDQPRNTLAVEVHGDETSFWVNGVTVHSMATSRVRPYGVSGVRVNHRLDVRVDDWRLGPPARASRP